MPVLAAARIHRVRAVAFTAWRQTDERRALEAQGYDIVANVGLNWVDLNGGYADTTWKLPDYSGLLD